MTIDTLDHLAYSTNNFLSRTSIGLKLLLVALVIAGVSTTYSITLLASWYGIMLAVMARRDLPFYTLIKISLYPLIFVIVFGITFLWGDWFSIGIIALKVLITSTTLITLIASTPYPAIFKALQPIISPMLASVLFLSYRSLFILMRTFTETIAILQLRGALRLKHPMRSLQAIGHGTGVTLLKSLHLSETMYETMRLRGFHNRIYFSKRTNTTLKANCTTLAITATLTILLIISHWPSPL